MAEAAKSKGTGPRGSRDYVIATHGAAAWRQILDRLPEDARKQMEDPLPFVWYPLPIVDATYRAICDVCAGGDLAKAEPMFRAMGKAVAADNLSTIYKVVLALAKPAHVFGMLPRLWTTYFSGIEVSLERGPDTSGIVRVNHLPFFGIAPTASGWIEFAYEKVGAKSSRVTERAWASGRPASAEMIFDVSWQA